MNSIADGSIVVQTSCQSVPSTPPWFGEVVLIVQYLRKHHILSTLIEHVRFARRRFGHYEVIDFLAVLFGYALSGERTLEAFYEHLSPFASADHWHFSHESVCQHAPHSVAFSRLCLPSPSKRCAACFSRICWLVLSCRRSSSQDCGIAREAAGRSLISMEPVRPLANALYLRAQSFLPPSVAYVRCVLRATLDVSEGKSSAPGPPFCKPTPPTGSAHLVEQAMARYGRSYAEP
jgi:hypothetical protein